MDPILIWDVPLLPVPIPLSPLLEFAFPRNSPPVICETPIFNNCELFVGSTAVDNIPAENVSCDVAVSGTVFCKYNVFA